MLSVLSSAIFNHYNLHVDSFHMCMHSTEHMNTKYVILIPSTYQSLVQQVNDIDKTEQKKTKYHKLHFSFIIVF